MRIRILPYLVGLALFIGTIAAFGHGLAIEAHQHAVQAAAAAATQQRIANDQDQLQRLQAALDNSTTINNALTAQKTAACSRLIQSKIVIPECRQ